MNLSPEQKDKFLRHLAEMALETIIAENGGTLSSLVVLPMAQVEKFTGLSRVTIPQKMSVTETCAGHHGVRLDVLQQYLTSVTVTPEQRRERKQGKAVAAWSTEIPTEPGFYWRFTPGYRMTLKHYDCNPVLRHTLTNFCRIYAGTQFSGPVQMPQPPEAPVSAEAAALSAQEKEPI